MQSWRHRFLLSNYFQSCHSPPIACRKFWHVLVHYANPRAGKTQKKNHENFSHHKATQRHRRFQNWCEKSVGGCLSPCRRAGSASPLGTGPDWAESCSATPARRTPCPRSPRSWSSRRGGPQWPQRRRPLCGK